MTITFNFLDCLKLLANFHCYTSFKISNPDFLNSKHHILISISCSLSPQIAISPANIKKKNGGEGWLGFPDLWSGQKPSWNWYLTPLVNFGEVWRVQSAKSTLLTSTLVLLGSSQICSDAKEKVGCRKQREATAPIQSLVKLQPWFLSLRWKTCLRQNCSLGSCTCSEGPALGQNDDDDDDIKNLRSVSLP